MKEEYDFSNAEQGKFYVPIENIQLPIYLDKDIIQQLNEKCLTTQESLQLLVNDLLRKDIEIAKRVTLQVIVKVYDRVIHTSKENVGLRYR